MPMTTLLAFSAARVPAGARAVTAHLPKFRGGLSTAGPHRGIRRETAFLPAALPGEDRSRRVAQGMLGRVRWRTCRAGSI